jgi:MscS family membrane protein
LIANKYLKKDRSLILLFLIFTAILIPAPIFGQPTLKKNMAKSPEDAKETDPQKTESKKSAVSFDTLGRETPRSSMKGFFKAVHKLDYKKATLYMDLRNPPRGIDKNDGPKLARHLKIVIHETAWIDYDLLSDDPKGHSEDGLPAYQDLLCSIETPKKEIRILLQRLPGGDGVFIWKFSNKTVAQIPRLYNVFGYGYLGEIIPEIFFDYEFFGLSLLMWPLLLIVLGFAYLAVLVATVLFTYSLRFITLRPNDRLKRFIAWPIRIFLTLELFKVLFVYLLNPPFTLRAVLEASTLRTIVLMWIIIGLVDFVFDYLSNRLGRSDHQSPSIVFMPVLRTSAKLVIIIIGIMLWLENIGIQLTTLLAGLGIGGLAVALAAQKSIENLIGAFTLYLAKPVSIGDFCKFGDTLGTVEEIGFRSTRLRTLDHTLISVPNAEFMSLHLNNFSKRKKIWFHPRIRLRYETTPDQIRNILNEIKKLLVDHPKVLSDPARVRFIDFGEYSLDLDIFAYISETDYGEYLKVAEELNLIIMDIVNQAGSGLALPSQTTYLENGQQLNEKLTRASETGMREWKEKEPKHE